MKKSKRMVALNHEKVKTNSQRIKENLPLLKSVWIERHKLSHPCKELEKVINQSLSMFCLFHTTGKI